MRRGGLDEAADDAEFGRIVRVHRRYPDRGDLETTPLEILLVLLIAAVPVFPLWLFESRWLPVALFGTGCAVGWRLIAPFYSAAARRAQFAIAEHGVLVWEPHRVEYAVDEHGVWRPHAASVLAAIAWSAVRTVHGKRITWRDADGNDKEIVIPRVVARRDLLDAFDRRAPVAPRPLGRVGPPVAAVVAALLFFGPLVWFGAVPAAVELIRGERPKDVFAFDRICDGEEPFGGSAPYRGGGPHPTVVVNDGSVRHVVGDDAPPGDWPAATVVQLVACGEKIGRVKPDVVRTCHYASTIDSRRTHTVREYQGRYRYEVREARTGRRVSTVTVDGDPGPYDCSQARFITDRTPDVSEIDHEPTGTQYDAAFGFLVSGTAPG